MNREFALQLGETLKIPNPVINPSGIRTMLLLSWWDIFSGRVASFTSWYMSSVTWHFLVVTIFYCDKNLNYFGLFLRLYDSFRRYFFIHVIFPLLCLISLVIFVSYHAIFLGSSDFSGRDSILFWHIFLPLPVSW